MWVLALAAVLAGAPGPWKQVEKGDVAVYTRDRPGESVSDVKAVMDMNATPAEIRDVLEDDSYARRQPHVKEYRTIDHPAPNVWDRYGRLTFPFFKDRDYFVTSTVNRDLNPDGSGSYHASWKPWGQDRPSRFNIVRLTKNSGYWDVQPLPGHRSQVTYEISVDPGGSIPGWAVNMVNKSVMPGVLGDLQKEVLRRRTVRLQARAAPPLRR
jgi:hypothetical protein